MIEIMEVDQSKSVIDHRLSLKFPKLIVAMSHQLKPLYVTRNFNGLAVLRFLVDNNGAMLDIMPLTLIKKIGQNIVDTFLSKVLMLDILMECYMSI